MKQYLHTNKAPLAIGPYSQAVKAGNTVYLSGQIPLNPETNQMIAGGIHEQVSQVFTNLLAVVACAGGTQADIVKLTIYLTDIAHAPFVNEVMVKFLTEPYPARVTIGVAQLPKNALVEIDAILVLSEL